MAAKKKLTKKQLHAIKVASLKKARAAKAAKAKVKKTYDAKVAEIVEETTPAYDAHRWTLAGPHEMYDLGEVGEHLEIFVNGVIKFESGDN